MEQVKLCPECGEEYYAHISECYDCEVLLKWPEEIGKKNIEENQIEDLSESGEVIKEDKMDLIKELNKMLLASGVPSKMVTCDGCDSGKCGTTYQLVVNTNSIEQANGLIDEYFLKIHPEMRESVEWVKEGRCPACGHHLGIDTEKCPDCGLLLDIE